jgi:hypothetical protein
MRPLVVLDDSLIMSLVNDVEFSTQIPCLYNKREVFRPGAGGCSSCARKRQEKYRREMATIKTCLSGLSPDKKALIRQKLDAQQVRILYVNGAGQTVQLTF